MEACNKANCVGLAGHRSVGGFRASLYNALELESVATLVQVMQDFEKGIYVIETAEDHISRVWKESKIEWDAQTRHDYHLWKEVGTF